MKKFMLCALGLSLLLSPLVADDVFSLEGYYKSFFTGFKLPDTKTADGDISTPPLGAVNNRLRLKLSYAPADWFKVQASYDFSPRIQDPLLFGESVFVSGLDNLSYRFDDFSTMIYPGAGDPVSSFGLFHNLDRLFVTLKTSFADIFIGRQAIAWGSAYMINPTDVVAPFAFNELDTEERRGVDAVRVRIPLGMMDELDLGYIFGPDFEFSASAFYLRGKFYLWKTDFSLVLMGFRENALFGLDISRSLGGAGLRFEAAYVVPGLLEDNRVCKRKEDDYLRASIGLDYNFSGKFYGFVEYHFNSAGGSGAEEYIRYLNSTAFREGTAYLLGKHYLGVGLTSQLTPLMPLTGMILYNIADGSFSLSPSLEYNIAENIYLAAGAYLTFGERPEILYNNPLDPTTLLHSEFGAYPHMFYTAFRVYF